MMQEEAGGRQGTQSPREKADGEGATCKKRPPNRTSGPLKKNVFISRPNLGWAWLSLTMLQRL